MQPCSSYNVTVKPYRIKNQYLMINAILQHKKRYQIILLYIRHGIFNLCRCNLNENSNI